MIGFKPHFALSLHWLTLMAWQGLHVSFGKRYIRRRHTILTVRQTGEVFGPLDKRYSVAQ